MRRLRLFLFCMKHVWEWTGAYWVRDRQDKSESNFKVMSAKLLEQLNSPCAPSQWALDWARILKNAEEIEDRHSAREDDLRREVQQIRGVLSRERDEHINAMNRAIDETIKLKDIIEEKNLVIDKFRQIEAARLEETS